MALSDQQRNKQYIEDQNSLAEVLQKHQNPNGHAEISVKVQDGFVVIISDTQKHKPRKVE